MLTGCIWGRSLEGWLQESLANPAKETSPFDDRQTQVRFKETSNIFLLGQVSCNCLSKENGTRDLDEIVLCVLAQM